MTMADVAARPFATASARVLTARLSEYRDLQSRLEEETGLLVITAAPWSGTSALVAMTLDDLAYPTLHVDARPCANAKDVAARVADAAVEWLVPEARAWWLRRRPMSDPAGLRLRQALHRRGIDAGRLRDGGASGLVLLADALAMAVELGGGPTFIALDHLDRLLDGLDASEARELLGVLRAARQERPDLQLVLVGRPDGRLGRALRDAAHPMYRAGDELTIDRPDPQRFVDDLAVVRPWTDVPGDLLGVAAELAAGVPFLTWQVIDLADAEGTARERALRGWVRLRELTEAQTGQTFDLLRRTHPLAQAVVVAISRDGRPYRVEANSKSVGDALARLRALGVAWQPRPRTWALGSPLLAAWARATTGVPRRRNIHTIKHGDGWANVYEGSSRVMDHAQTKAAAVRSGRERARKNKVEHIVHKADGTIGERNSYGRDGAWTLVEDT
jgi:hypothetical protein